MPQPLHVPRVNNNDDTVQLVGIKVAVGDRVTRGELVAEVETDKSVSEVTAECDGYVLEVLGRVNEQVAVGSIMMWIGDTPQEQIPQPAEIPGSPLVDPSLTRPTAKARALLRQHGLDADQVPARGERLTVADIEQHLGQPPRESAGSDVRDYDRCTAELYPEVAGERIDLSAQERGMLHTVSWHRDVAVAGYLEIGFDPSPWDEYARRYAKENRLMLSPLLALLAYRLAQLANEHRQLNSTIVGSQRHEYQQVNLGFTVQAGDTLYLTVVRDAASMDCARFIDALGTTQRHAIAHKLPTEEAQGVTIGFTSMARWGVSRHVPVLAPHTAVMVAHSAPHPGEARAVLGGNL